MSTYTVPALFWWALFSWGALGWLGAGAVSLFSGRYCARLERELRRKRFAETVLPPPSRPAQRDWRDSHLPTQVQAPGSPNRSPTRSFTPAEVRAAHIASRK